MRVALFQLDGKLPNLALMNLSHFYKSRGAEVIFSRNIRRDILTPSFDKVYASCIFGFSRAHLNTFKAAWPEAEIGGTGSDSLITVDEIIGTEHRGLDYSIYPDYQFSLGFSQRGCRLNCGFCVVPKKEGKPRTVATINDLWRGDPHPRNICLLDNDFFGQPREEWTARIREIKTGGFKVCFNQGINIRLVDEEAANYLKQIEYRDDQFKRRRLYTAWDNFKDEAIFFKGVSALEAAGIPAKHLMVYMLVGYDPAETWERIWHRFSAMVWRGAMPYPMVYNNVRKDLKAMQRWTCTGLYRGFCWPHYSPDFKMVKSDESISAWHKIVGEKWKCRKCKPSGEPK